MSSIGDPDPIVVVVHGPIGLATVDALARLQLAALQLGGCICLRDAPDELYELLSLAGLRAVLRAESELVGCGRQPEQREELVDLEEEADP
ncbi:MAG: hypothetical protein WAT66_06400 [Actinomycetota bacterium]